MSEVYEMCNFCTIEHVLKRQLTKIVEKMPQKMRFYENKIWLLVETPKGKDGVMDFQGKNKIRWIIPKKQSKDSRQRGCSTTN